MADGVPAAELPEWAALTALQKDIQEQGVTMRQLFEEDSQRFEKFSVQLEDVLVDFSKNIITDDVLAALLALAEATKVPEVRDMMLSGYVCMPFPDAALVEHSMIPAKKSIPPKDEPCFIQLCAIAATRQCWLMVLTSWTMCAANLPRWKSSRKLYAARNGKGTPDCPSLMW